MIVGAKRREVWERDNGICGICNDAVTFDEMEIDHRFPRSHGGPDDMANLQPAHEPCNRRKGITCSGYLTTKQAADRLGWSDSTLRSRLGWNGIRVSQFGSGNILIAESEIDVIDRDGWPAYRQERERQHTAALFAELDERKRRRPAVRGGSEGE